MCRDREILERYVRDMHNDSEFLLEFVSTLEYIVPIERWNRDVRLKEEDVSVEDSLEEDAAKLTTVTRINRTSTLKENVHDSSDSFSLVTDR